MGKREIAKQRRKQQQTRNNLTAIIIIAILAVAAVVIVILTQNKPAANPTAPVGDIVVPDRTTTAQKDGLTLGSPDAKVKVIEFADFQCPACSSYWSQLEPTIIQQYVETGKVEYTYNPFSFLGQGQAWDESKKAAEAAFCANDQQKFWEYHDIIFANHNGENQGAYSKERLVAFAEALKLDMTAFNQCFDSGIYAKSVDSASTFASQQGATYTPSFLIDGKIVNANELVQAIETSLAK